MCENRFRPHFIYLQPPDILLKYTLTCHMLPIKLVQYCVLCGHASAPARYIYIIYIGTILCVVRTCVSSYTLYILYTISLCCSFFTKSVFRICNKLFQMPLDILVSYVSTTLVEQSSPVAKQARHCRLQDAIARGQAIVITGLSGRTSSPRTCAF